MEAEHNKKNKFGLLPGSLVYTGNATGTPTDFSLIQYRNEKNRRLDSDFFSAIVEAFDPKMVNWINIDGLSNEQAVGQVGEHFNIHSLVMEDILNVDQLPKFEDHEEYLFLTLKMLSLDKDKKGIEVEQVSFILGNSYLLSFQERPGDLFEPTRNRIDNCLGKVTQYDADYLLYRLVDTIVDNYYLVMNHVSDEISKLELTLLKDPGPDSVREITKLKRKIIMLRKHIHPVREALRSLYNLETDLVSDKTSAFINDVMDHVNHIIQDLEVQREALNGFFDLYNSNLSNKMNGIMKTLTVITTIFIPLTFIVGVYGMNFKHMPELDWEYGYPAALGVMVLTGIGMMYYMKRKDWL